MKDFYSTTLQPNSLTAIFDISNACTCKCIMCHRQLPGQSGKPVKFMRPDKFGAIIASILPYLKKLTLSAAGEPLTSPYFNGLLKILDRFGTLPHINFLTNGILLNKHYADAITDSPISEICFSVHGATKQTYEDIIKGASFKKLTDNISYLSSAINKSRKNTPCLHFNVTLMRRNIEELEDIVALAASLGIQTISFRHLILYRHLGLESESLIHNKELTNYWLERALERATALNINVLNCPDFFSLQQRSRIPAKKKFIKTFIGRLTNGLPFGFIDTPENSNSFDKEIHLSGWAMSRSGIDRVEMHLAPEGTGGRFRNKDLIPLGTARFHNATRPDLFNQFPGIPMNNRAGWTFSMPSQNLPAHHRLKPTIRATAYDRKGNRYILGTRTSVYVPEMNSIGPPLCRHPFNTIYVDNYENVYPHPDCNTKIPFGSFDTESIHQIWGNNAFTDLRRRIAEHDPPDMCKTCGEFINREVDSNAYFKPKLI
ncbi:MAG: radical SAM protein [Desulfobacterales bacterium]|nr:radical SAM protein [Desulfobacterales bacterium]